MDVGLAVAQGFGARRRRGKFHRLLGIECLRIERASVHPAGRCEGQRVQEGQLTRVVSFVRVQVARGTHHVIGGHGDAHVKRAELRVKFPLVEVRHGVPTIAVVHRGLGVPLGQLIRLTDVAEAADFARR